MASQTSRRWSVHLPRENGVSCEFLICDIAVRPTPERTDNSALLNCRCGNFAAKKSSNSSRSLDRGSRGAAGLSARARKSEGPDCARTATNLIHGIDRGLFRALHFFSTRTDTDLFPRSEHSQGGAQRSEQYLYGAQRAIESRGDSRKLVWILQRQRLN